MSNYKLTLIGTTISIIILLYSIIYNVDIFEIFLSYLHSLEKFEVDEFIIPAIIIIVCLLSDTLRQQKKNKIELDKIKIYKAMISAVHHILNNFLQKMQLYKLKAERTPSFDREISTIYNQIIKDATIQINALSNITEITESSITNSVSPGFNTCRNTQQDAAADAEKPRR